VQRGMGLDRQWQHVVVVCTRDVTCAAMPWITTYVDGRRPVLYSDILPAQMYSGDGREEGGRAMETTNGHPYTWCDPEHEESHGGIAHRAVNGWVRLTRWNGQQTVLKVETVRVFQRVYMEILWPPPRLGYPVYEDGFPAGRIECLPESEALVWLEKHGLPLPGDVARSEQDPVHVE
jgi:hypothetical protein